MTTDDPFPKERFAATIRRLPAYVRLSAAVAMDPKLAKKRRAAVIAAAGYLVSPVDLVPGVIPVLGQLDDIAFALAALRLALAGLDPARRAEHLAKVGLADDDLTEDLSTLGVVAAWTLRAGARTTKRVVVRGGGLAAAGARAAGAAAATGASRLAPTVRTAAEPLARTVAAATPDVAADAARVAAARVGPAARGAAERISPVARDAGSRLGAAARGAAAKGASAAKGAAAHRPAVKVSVPDRLALPSPRPAPAEDRLEVEPDVIDPGA